MGWGICLFVAVSLLTVAYSAPNGAAGPHRGWTPVGEPALSRATTVTKGPTGQNLHERPWADPVAKYNLTFTETGLPVSTYWSVSLTQPGPVANLTITTSPTSIIYSLPNGTYPYAVTSTQYAAGATFSNVTVNGSNVTVRVAFTAQPTYLLLLNETGLTPATFWSLTLDAVWVPAFGNITIGGIPNGTYAFAVLPKAAWNVTPSSGSIKVDGANAEQAISFTPVETTYPMVFTETGLAPGTEWWLNGTGTNLTGNTSFRSNTTTLTIDLQNGTYTFVPAASSYAPELGPIYVGVDGIGGFGSVAFIRTYALTFTETGLVVGSSWAVAVSGACSGGPLSSSSSTIRFAEPNGSCSFSVTQIPAGYSGSPASGSLRINGAPQTVLVKFTSAPVPRTFDLDFIESGLPGQTLWSVTLGSNSLESESGTIAFAGLTNGTYTFTVSGGGGLVATPGSGSVFVKGANLTKTIAFGGSPSLTFLGLPANEGYAVLGGILAAAVLAGLWAVFRSRRRKPPPEPSSAPAPPASQGPPGPS